MNKQIASAAPRQWMHGLSRAFTALRDRGFLIDGRVQGAIKQTVYPGAPVAAAPTPSCDQPPINLFVRRLRELLATDSETHRQQLEQQLLALAVPLRDAGVFDVVRIAHPPLAAMVADYLYEHESNRVAPRV